MFFNAPSVSVPFPRTHLHLIKQKENTHTHTRTCTCIIRDTLLSLPTPGVMTHVPALYRRVVRADLPAATCGQAPGVNQRRRANICFSFHTQTGGWARNTNVGKSASKPCTCSVNQIQMSAPRAWTGFPHRNIASRGAQRLTLLTRKDMQLRAHQFLVLPCSRARTPPRSWRGAGRRRSKVPAGRTNG